MLLPCFYMYATFYSWQYSFISQCFGVDFMLMFSLFRAGLKIPEVLSKGPRTAAQIAEAAQRKEGFKAKECKVRRLLRYLVGRGIFERGPDASNGDPQFQNNELTNHMRRCEHADYMVSSVCHSNNCDLIWLCILLLRS